MKYSDSYYLKYIVYQNKYEFKSEKDNIVFCSIDKIFACIDDSECLFISNTCDINDNSLIEIIRYSLNNDHKIIVSGKSEQVIWEIADSLNKRHLVISNTIIDKAKKTNGVPIVLFSSISSDIERTDFILSLKKTLKNDYSINATVVGWNAYDMLLDIKMIPDCSTNKYNDTESIINIKKQLNEIQQNSSSDIILVDFPGGIRNPYYPSDYLAEMNLLRFIRAVEIDYSLHIVPMNCLKDNTICIHKKIIEENVGLKIDRILISDSIFDLKHPFHDKTDIKMLNSEYEEATKIIKTFNSHSDYLRMSNKKTVTKLSKLLNELFAC